MISAALLLLLLAFGSWLLATESGAQVALRGLNVLSAGTVTAQGIHGRLAGPLRIERLVLEREDQQLSMKDIRLDWQPSALLQGRLRVNSLRAAALDVVSKIQKKSDPLRLPNSLVLPIRLQFDRVQIDSGTISWGPLNLIELGALAFKLDFDGTQYRFGIDRFSISAATAADPITGHFSGQANLAAVKPYAVQGSFSSSAKTKMQDQAVGATGRVDITGFLTELATTVDLVIDQVRNQAQAKGRIVLRPFSKQPLGNANLVLQALDLSSFSATLPQTQLDMRLTAADNSAGELRLSNAAAGLYNEAKLPLADLLISFRQSEGQFNFEQITATLGSAKRPAGTLAGSGRYADGALTLALSTKALDLQKMDQRIRATRLSGTVDVKHAAGKQEMTIALNEPLKKNTLALSAHAVLADGSVTVDKAELQAGAGRVNASGHVAFSGRQSFLAEGRVSRFRLQDLGEFSQLPNLDLNGNFSLRGTRAPQLEADLAFKINDSRIGGHPLQGNGQAQLRADRVSVPRLLLTAGDNRLTMQGELAQAASRLSFSLNAPQLQQLGPKFGGALHASGIASGAFKAPRVNAEWKAERVRLPGELQIGSMQGSANVGVDPGKPFFINDAVLDATVRNLQFGSQKVAASTARLRFSPQANAPLALDVHLQGTSFGTMGAERIDITAAGTTARHVIDASLVEAGQSWRLKATGGLRELSRTAQWQGNVERLDATGSFTARLAAPAPLFVSQTRVQLDRLRIDATTGVLAVDKFLRDPTGIATQGRIERFQIAPLLKFATPDPAFTTDLQLDGEWNVVIDDTPSGSITLRRQQGDIVMRGSAPVALGLSTLDGSASLSAGTLDLQLKAEGRQLGNIDINANTRLENTARRLSIAPNASLSGNARIDIPGIGWVAPLMSPTLIAEGRVQSAVALSGTFSDPRFAGQLKGSGLRLFFTDSGIDLRQGILEGEFNGSELLVRNLRFQNEGGYLALSGPVNLAGRKPDAQLSLIAERFTVLNRPDRRLTVSGSSQIGVTQGRAAISGAFQVNSGFFDLGREGKPQLSDDVVIVGRTKKSPGTAAALDISIGLGDGVSLKGRGLDALLVGQIRLRNAAGEPLQALGSLSIAKGTYKAYGRELAIEQGLLRFSGPLNNPALDIRAMRRAQEVEAGVAVRGTVLVPRVTLVSEPSVPDAEKLSWLVLGHGLTAAGDTDLSALQAAAAALLSDSAAAGVQSQIATSFGLDTVGISTSQDNLQQRIITLGKQISSRLYVSFQQGLETATSTLLLRYTLSPRVTLEAEAGTRSVLSLFYNISFD